MCAPGPAARWTRRASSRSRASPATWSRRRRTCAAASTACRRRPSANPKLLARVREGLEGIERSFLGLLERNGIRREDPTGAAFDPNQHQAMAEQETLDHPPGTVVQAWTPAWTLHGRLLRPAMVVVAKAPAAELSGPAGARVNTSA